MLKGYSFLNDFNETKDLNLFKYYISSKTAPYFISRKIDYKIYYFIFFFPLIHQVFKWYACYQSVFFTQIVFKHFSFHRVQTTYL